MKSEAHSPRHRLLAIPGLVLLHMLAYATTARLVPLREPGSLLDLSIPLDGLVPYLPWSWIVYWAVWPFVLIGGGALLLRLPAPKYRRALAAFVILTVMGPLFHNAFPSRAPWLEPHQLVGIQRWVHESAVIEPHANLPSMHVAYPALVTLFWIAQRPPVLVRVSMCLLTLAIAASTVTLKEHFVVDPIGGLLLAGAVYLWWRRGVPGSPSVRSTARAGKESAGGRDSTAQQPAGSANR